MNEKLRTLARRLGSKSPLVRRLWRLRKDRLDRRAISAVQIGNGSLISVWARSAIHKSPVLTGVWRKSRRVSSAIAARFRKPQTFSMVVAIYNVEPYIERFLQSVLNQDGGLKGLEVILVNDGTPDGAGEIARRWAARHPQIFRYMEQENQSVAAARNAGLAVATGDWISFPDPDNFLSPNYLDAARAEAGSRVGDTLLAIIPNLILYLEAADRYANTHALRYKYSKGRRRYSTDDLGHVIQNSASYCWLRRSAVLRHGLQFDPRVKPTFEDGHFVNRLFLLEPGKTVTILPAPKYYYRRRIVKNSAVDGSQHAATWYHDAYVHGYLDLLRIARETRGTIPVFLQRTVLYESFWRIKHVLDHPERTGFLSDQQRETFRQHLRDIFAAVDVDTIRDFNLAGCSEEHKVALLAIYKSARQPVQRVYLRDHDPAKGLFRFTAYTGGDDGLTLAAVVDGTPRETLFSSRRRADFLGQTYYAEHHFWVALRPGESIEFRLCGEPANIRRKGWEIGGQAGHQNLLSALPDPVPHEADLPDDVIRLRRHSVSAAARRRFAGCWVLLDRDDKADDNAEHLYRYLKSTDVAAKAFFALSPDSPDWERLHAEGFQLLAFGSDDHVAAVVNAEFVISSDAVESSYWPIPPHYIQDLAHYRFVFLQHGVMSHDLSLWLNGKKIDALVCSTRAEYDSIAAPQSPYVFSHKEAVLTGLPRYDNLLRLKANTARRIVVMPTWRKELAGAPVAGTSQREKLEGFAETAYARHWHALLCDRRLAEIARQNSLSIIFAPHPNMVQYLDDLALPAHVATFDPGSDGGYQALFASAAVLVTDYSSVCFDVAYLERPSVYFQFDEAEFYAGDHTYSQGYFSFRDHAFGPVVQTADQVFKAVCDALEGREDPEYARRRRDTFPFRDGKCSERVYRAILALNDPLPSPPGSV